MSSGDVVCTGWLIKSPPEKKLKRYVSAEALLIFFFFLAKGISACARCLTLPLKSLARFGFALDQNKKNSKSMRLWSILVSTDILVPSGINLSRLVRLQYFSCYATYFRLKTTFRFQLTLP